MPTYLPIQPGCEFYPYGAGRYVLHTPDQRHFLVSSTTKEILEALTASTPLEVLCENLSAGDADGTTAEELKGLLEKRYAHLGIFTLSLDPRPDDGDRSLTGGVAFLRCWDLLPAPFVRAVAARLRWLYNIVPAALAAVAIVAAHLSLYSHAVGGFHLRLPHGSSLAILFLSLLSILAHEMGHATALSRFNATPGKIGFGLYLLMPAFFADVSEVWRLPRRGRFAVDLGGVYFQQAAFVVFAFFAAAYSSLEFAAPCYAIDTMTLFALNPVFRFDGYWLLADWLELPKLQRDAIQLLKHWGSRLLTHIRPQTRPILETRPPLTRVQTLVFAVYAISCNLFMVLSIVVSLRYLRSNLFGFAHRLPAMFSKIGVSAAAGDWATVTDQIVLTLVASAFSATAVFGLCLYFARLFAAIRRMVQRSRFSPATSLSSTGHNL